MEAQRLNLKLTDGNTERLVCNFKEIGKVWKLAEITCDMAPKINQIINGQFEKHKGYEFYIEGEVMKRLRLTYEKNNLLTGTHCIAMMVTRRKCDLAKSMMTRGNNTHGFKITSSRASALIARDKTILELLGKLDERNQVCF